VSLVDTTSIRIEDHRTTLSGGTKTEVVIAVGVRDLAERLFRHDPPTPHEIEQAIDRVEDALAATGLRQAVRGDLLTRESQLHSVLGLTATGDRLTRDAVELRFQHIALTSLGHSGLRNELQADRVDAAVLLILRECMHHLGYDGVVRGGG
jgi:hypothetical protein